MPANSCGIGQQFRFSMMVESTLHRASKEEKFRKPQIKIAKSMQKNM